MPGQEVEWRPMSQVTFKRPDGKDCSGFYVEPAAGKEAPGVVIIQ